MVVAEDEQRWRTEERRVVRHDPRELLEGKLKSTRQKLRVRNKGLKGSRQKLYETTNKALVEKDWAELLKHRKWRKSVQQEIFELERRLHALEKGGVEGEPVTGALPDFVVIGGQKCGTTFFYDLLTQHAFVEPAASKE